MVWLLDCWYIHKSKEFLDWMKKKHSNTLVIFVPCYRTNVLQPTNMILQCPLKHVFKMGFNGWIINIIKSQIDTSANLHVDFKMSNLKPKICGWLHQVWMEVKAMKPMLTCQEKTRLTWDNDFQLATLEANTNFTVYNCVGDYREIDIVDDYDPT
jgi:hypothetical protein